ncbi:hypothetical protein ML462_04455 [Gramella lutea]|uniref:Uncharacterized protein n=1 Tax=Christiangramia lutea TaxID=1607951 RepID=A0A9X2A9S0_9FLAO|nr:hypothetical protein [Christiangramia lutea]MCH4822416.1 hypothetical protein [Christiangramia lutea]
MNRSIFLFVVVCLTLFQARAQSPDEDQLGAWYMYFWNTNFGESNGGCREIINIVTGEVLETGNNYYYEQD